MLDMATLENTGQPLHKRQGEKYGVTIFDILKESYCIKPTEIGKWIQRQDSGIDRVEEK